MSIDDELMKAAEEDAREVAFIQNQLPQDLKERFSDDDIYYIIDVLLEYFSKETPDSDGYFDIDLDELTDYVIRQAKKDNMPEMKHDEVFFVVQAELDYNEQMDA